MTRAQSKIIKTTALYILLFFSLLVIKVFISSRSEYYVAEKAAASGDFSSALTHYERAILWYLPIGGYVEASASAMWRIARDLENADKQAALNAYRSIRSAFIAARSYYTPGQAWIARAEERIAVLMAEQTVYSESDRQKPPDQKTKEALAILRRPTKPDTFWSSVVVIGFLGWMSAVLMFIWKAFHEGSMKIKVQAGLFWGCVVVVFYALWMIGMSKA